MAVVPWPYILFFHYIEPIATLIGAYYAQFRKHDYLLLTHASSAPLLGSTLPASTSIVLTQLANLYAMFAVNEALVLRVTNDMRVWRAVLFGLLLADLGHLYSVAELGNGIYWDIVGWNSIHWGNIAFVYCGAATRICFLLGIGLSEGSRTRKKGKR